MSLWKPTKSLVSGSLLHKLVESIDMPIAKDPTTKPIEKIWAFCDGGLGTVGAAESNRRPNAEVVLGVGCGALLRGQDGRVLDWAWRSLPKMTNNEAEYAGLLLGMELTKRLLHRRLRVPVLFVLDSEIVVGQMRGCFAVNSKKLKRWHQIACRQAETFDNICFCAVPRAWNPLADALARQAGVPWEPLRAAIERRTAQQPLGVHSQ